MSTEKPNPPTQSQDNNQGQAFEASGLLTPRNFGDVVAAKTIEVSAKPEPDRQKVRTDIIVDGVTVMRIFSSPDGTIDMIDQSLTKRAKPLPKAKVAKKRR